MKKILLLLFLLLLIPNAVGNAQDYETAGTTEFDLFYYSKNGNIWVYNHTVQNTSQLTQDGELDPLSWRGSYYSPSPSPSGAYIAYESSENFYIHTVEDQSTIHIEKAASPDIAADSLLGWDDKNQLYFTLTYGECIADQFELSGPDAVIVYRYDPVSQEIKTVGELPIPAEPEHAYAIGLNISPDGKIVTYQSVLCYAGFGSAVNGFDLISGKIVPNPEDADQLNIKVDPGWVRTSQIEISPDGKVVAYLVQEGFQDGEFFIPADETGPSVTRLILAPTLQLSDAQYYEANIVNLGKWSNNGQRIYFSVAPNTSDWTTHRRLDYLDIVTGELVTVDEGDLINF